MSRIVVLFHANETRPDRYVVHHLSGFWREDGHQVEYVFGTKRFVPADLVFVHVDLSVVPDSYLEFAARYPRTVNGHLADIRKSTVSRNVVRRGDGWTGPVIVKSDLNYGGKPEDALQRTALERRFPRVYWWRHRFDQRFRPARVPIGDIDYDVFESIDAVPEAVFSDSRLVIERFLPEIEDGCFHMRIVQMLGDRMRCTRLRSDHEVIKAHRSSASREVDPHPEIHEWRREHGLDYGKLDYVVHDGRPVLLDVNKTIGATSSYRDEATLAVNRRFLAEGLYGYLD